MAIVIYCNNNKRTGKINEKVTIARNHINVDLFLKAQNDTVEVVFEGFYEIREGDNAEKYYSILFDSTFYQNENLTFLRVLNIGNESDRAESLIIGQTYSFVIQRKFEQSFGCVNYLSHSRSSRAITDKGTLFGSSYLEKHKVIAAESDCEYKAIEYYYILVINKNGG